MIDSDWAGGSVVKGQQGPLGSDAELPVEPDRGGQGQQSLADADKDPAQGPEPARLILAVGADQEGAQPSDVAFELGPGQALVGQDDRAGRQGLLAGGVLQQRLGDLAFAKAGAGQETT